MYYCYSLLLILLLTCFFLYRFFPPWPSLSSMNSFPFSFFALLFFVFLFLNQPLGFCAVSQFLYSRWFCNHFSVGHETGRIIPTWYTTGEETVVLIFWCSVHIFSFFFPFLEYSVRKMSFVPFNQFYLKYFFSPSSPASPLAFLRGGPSSRGGTEAFHIAEETPVLLSVYCSSSFVIKQ